MTKTSGVSALVGIGTGLSMIAGLMLVGCGKKEEAPAAPAPAQTTIVTANGVQVQVREESGVSRYSDEGPEIGTVRTNRSLELRKSADNTSPVVGNVGAGVMVNKKARRGAFFLVDFPAAGGGMTPGWLDQHEVTGGALPIVTTTTVPPATTTVPPVVTTAPPVAATTTTPPGGRPPIRIPGKKLASHYSTRAGGRSPDRPRMLEHAEQLPFPALLELSGDEIDHADLPFPFARFYRLSPRGRLDGGRLYRERGR